MRRFTARFILIVGLTLLAIPVHAQHQFRGGEQWQTAGAGLSTPLGFNLGVSYSRVLAGPLFAQGSTNFSKDVFVTKHGMNVVGAGLGVRLKNDVLFMSVSASPAFVWGQRGFDMLESAGMPYRTVGASFLGQLLFKKMNMGYEVYATVNSVRSIGGMRIIYHVGNLWR